MRILIFTNSDLGLYKFRFELLEELLKENEVYICTPYGEFVEKMQIIGCKYIPCSYLDRRGTNPINDFKLVKYYNKILSKIKPDTVLTYTIKPNVYGGLLCILKKIPYIANVTGLGTSIENRGLISFISLILYKIGLKKAKCVFFQNNYNQEFFIKKHIVKGKNRLIPGSGVNLIKNCLEPYPDFDGKIRFLYVGRIMRDKGIEELLNAYCIIHRKYTNTELLIVGDFDEDYKSFIDNAQKENDISFYGKQQDVHKFYTSTHCTILPSYHEGTANVLLEAAATGRPIITTRVPGCIETFDEGKTGFGCDVKNIDSLVSAMEKFLSLDYSDMIKMGILGREKMCKSFDRNIVINAYLEELSRIRNI